MFQAAFAYSLGGIEEPYPMGPDLVRIHGQIPGTGGKALIIAFQYAAGIASCQFPEKQPGRVKGCPGNVLLLCSHFYNEKPDVQQKP